MPFPLVPVIGAGAQLLGQGINAIMQKKQNKINWRQAQESYDKQRRDNLSDWNMQNAYNHPSEQMKRLKEAGLNPNLVYGSGATAVTAQQTKSASQDTAPGQPVQFDLGGIVNQFIQTQQLQQQTDNLRELNKYYELRNQGENLRNLLTDVKISREDRGLRMDELKLGAMPKNIELGQAGMNLKNKQIEIQSRYTLDENQRRAVLTSQSLKEGVKKLLQMDLDRAYTRLKMNESKVRSAQGIQSIQESKQRVNQSKQQVKNLEAAIGLIDRKKSLDDFEIELNKRGFSKNDPVYMRIAAQAAQNAKEETSTTYDYFNE